MKTTPTHIHLGISKTATTSLQRNLFCNHPQVYYFGKFPDGSVLEAVRPSILSKVCKTRQIEPGDIRSASIHEQLEYATANGRTPILSQEGWSIGTFARKQAQARLFQEHFGDCKIILFVREPVSFMQSFYTQQMMNFQVGMAGRGPDWMKKIKKPPHYFDINEWMALSWSSKNSPRQVLSYAETAQAYAEVFGKENLSIFIFEELVRQPEPFIKKFCDHLGIDGEDGWKLMNEQRANTRITTETVEQINALEKSIIQRIKFRRADKNTRWSLLFPCEPAGEKFKPEFSAEWLEEIHALGTAQNRRLVEEWNLPLSDYGYRL